MVTRSQFPFQNPRSSDILACFKWYGNSMGLLQGPMSLGAPWNSSFNGLLYSKNKHRSHEITWQFPTFAVFFSKPSQNGATLRIHFDLHRVGGPDIHPDPKGWTPNDSLRNATSNRYAWLLLVVGSCCCMGVEGFFCGLWAGILGSKTCCWWMWWQNQRSQESQE